MRHLVSMLYAVLDIREVKQHAVYRHKGHSQAINENIYQAPLTVELRAVASNITTTTTTSSRSSCPYTEHATSPFHVMMPAIASTAHKPSATASTSSSSSSTVALALHMQWLTGLLCLAVQAGPLPQSADAIVHNSLAALMTAAMAITSHLQNTMMKTCKYMLFGFISVAEYTSRRCARRRTNLVPPPTSRRSMWPATGWPSQTGSRRSASPSTRTSDSTAAPPT